jgi:selenide,water dikinase
VLQACLKVKKTRRSDGALLVGGHTAEGAELSLALAVNGHIEPGEVRAKDTLQAGDVLVLSKALGTGIVMAAEMRGLARSEWLEACVAQMLATNAAAAAELARFEVHALTDVTGFGLAGHLAEMLRRGGLRAILQLGALPVLPGACELSAQGVRSSLHRQNERLIPAITVTDQADLASTPEATVRAICAAASIDGDQGWACFAGAPRLNASPAASLSPALSAALRARLGPAHDRLRARLGRTLETP